MIKDHCFTEEWLEHFKQQSDHQRIDKIILEKMIYALHLLEQLKLNGLDFVFKGGTSLVLLLEAVQRFSIDIDIICSVEQEELEAILDKAVASSCFSNWTLDKHRSYQAGVPKAHYKFGFNSRKQGSGTILLDILLEESIYPEHVTKPIASKWIETTDPTLVKVPSIDAITGDKLTAFAPNTIGIPYFKGKGQSFAMEICKQLFDLSQLFEQMESVKMVAESFQLHAQQEITYRTANHPTLHPEDVLHDTIETCLTLTKRGKGDKAEKDNFKELQRGITSFGTSYLMKGRFRIDEALPAAARVAHLAAKILVGDLSSISYFDGHDTKDWTIEHPKWNFLNRLKKQPDKSIFFYWYHTVQLLNAQL